MDALRQWYLARLAEKLRRFDNWASALASDVDGQGVVVLGVEVREHAHRLRGSAGAYGYPEVSRVAARVEEAADDALASELAELVRVVARTIDGTA